MRIRGAGKLRVGPRCASEDTSHDLGITRDLRWHDPADARTRGALAAALSDRVAHFVTGHSHCRAVSGEAVHIGGDSAVPHGSCVVA